MERLRGKIQQLVVQFACRTPPRKELPPVQRRTLQSRLGELDRDFFQLFNKTPPEDAPHLFQVLKQYTIGAVTVTLPSLTVTPDSITLLSLVKAGEKSFTQDKTLETGHLHAKMQSYLTEIGNILQTRFIRAGKIYEITLGPFTAADKTKLFEKIFSFPVSDVSQVHALITKVAEHGNYAYNIHTDLKFQQLRPEDPFAISLRVDINNRNYENSLEPRDIERVWKKADEVIWGHLESLVG